MIEHGIAAWRQMQMVSALDAERDGISERAKHQIGPGTQRDDNFARDRRAVRSGHAPAARTLFERPGVADDKPSTLALEKRRIGLGQSTRIRHESGCGKMDGAGEISGQMRLARRDRITVENVTRHAVLPCPLEIAHRIGERRL